MKAWSTTIHKAEGRFKIMNASMNSSGTFSDAPRHSAWYPESQTRGTYSLLSTCIITITLCVWSASRQKILQYTRGESQWSKTLPWVVCAIFVPELFVWIAIIESTAAKRACREIRDAFGMTEHADPSHSYRRISSESSLEKAEKEEASDISLSENLLQDSETSTRPTRSPWTKRHSFYVMMGGLALDTRDSGEAFLLNYRERVALTTEGLKYLISLDPSWVPDITEADVRGRSKPSGFIKTLACVQAVWFCLNCVARASQRLPLSLLELNTAAYSLCVVVLYVMQWKMPLDIEQPTVIRVNGDKMRSICAYMWMASGMSCMDGNGKPLPEFESLQLGSGAPSGSIDEGLTFPLTIRGPLTPNPASKMVADYTGFSLRAESNRFIAESKPSSERNMEPSGIESQRIYRPEAHLPVQVKLRRFDLIRWKLASKAVHEYGLPRPDHTDHSFFTVEPKLNLSDRDKLPGRGTLSEPCIAITMLSAMYASIHATAWNYNFVSSNERFCWRVSSVILTTPILLALLLLPRKLGRQGSVILFTMTIIPLFLNIPARLFITLESVKDVFYLESNFFQQSVCSQYIPHIG